MAFDATDFTAPVRLLDRDPKSLTEPRERLEFLRDFLRELPAERFDMDRGSRCIGGWSSKLFGVGMGGSFAKYGDALGLTRAESLKLFFPPRQMLPWRRVRRPYDATPIQAANVLDHLIRTGEVDWSVA